MLIDTLAKCSACGSGICLSRSVIAGKSNWCLTLQQTRELEKECPTCGTHVPESSIQKGKRSLK